MSRGAPCVKARLSDMRRLINSRSRLHGQANDGGSAVVEFTVLAVLVMVPLAYAVLVVVRIHAATYGAVTAAREAGRAYVTADTVAHAAVRAQAAAGLALADQGLEEPRVTVSCLGGTCLTPGSRVRVQVITSVAIPFVPTRTDSNRGQIPVTAIHETTVDTYRSSP